MYVLANQPLNKQLVSLALFSPEYFIPNYLVVSGLSQAPQETCWLMWAAMGVNNMQYYTEWIYRCGWGQVLNR